MAEARFREIVARAPNFIGAWSELGKICFEEDRFAEAVEAFSRAAELDDGNAELHHNRAAALGMLKRYREAAEADRLAIARSPGFSDAYIGLAISLKALGDTAGAIAAARQAYTLNAADPRPLQLLRQLQ